MSVTLNIKSSKSFVELFPKVPMTSYQLSILAEAEIYYQPHCFDVLIPCCYEVQSTGASTALYVRFHCKNTGLLISGALGNTIKQQLAKSVNHVWKQLAPYIVSVNKPYAFDVNEGHVSTNVNITYGMHASYADFLVSINDIKAIPKDMAPVAEVPVAAALTPPEEIGEEQTHVVDKPYKCATAGHMKDGPVLSLSVATALLQKVRGSGPDAVYLTCGMSQLLNAAYRYKNNVLSVRVEPPKGMNHTEASSTVKDIQGCQLSMHFKQPKTYTELPVMDYASIHLVDLNYKQARRVLGAIMADLEIFKPHEMTLELKDSKCYT